MARWWTAALGAIGGAAIAVAIVYGAAAYGLLPGVGDRAMHAYLTNHPEVLAEMTTNLQARQDAADDASRQAAVNKLGLKTFFDPRLAFVTGPAKAKSTLVEFYDYDCPYCRASLPAMKKFYATHKHDTRFAFIELPLAELHGPGAVVAARASLAARNQPDKFAEFYFTLMGEEDSLTDEIIYADAAKSGLDVARLKKDMNDPSISTTLAAGHNLAVAAKIDGTPAFIINGHIREGAVDDDLLNAMAKS